MPRIPPRPLLHFLLFLGAAFALSAYLQFRTPYFPDRDAFYHFGHALAYRERGPFYGAFPWASASVIRQYGADLWYGFHLALLPFTAAPDPIFGMKLAGACFLTVALGLYYWSLARLEVRWPAAGSLVLLFCGAPALLRCLALRPQVLTLGLSALLLSLLFRGRLRYVALVAALLTWLHLSFFWLALLVAGTVVLARLACERRWEWRPLVAVIAGVGVGWLLRPHPLGAAQLLYVQLPVLLSVRQTGVPLLYGKELFPRPPGELIGLFFPFLALWGLALGAAAWKRGAPAAEKTREISAGVLAALFFGLTLFHSARSTDPWKTFAVFFIALVFSSVAGWAPRVRWGVLGAGAACGLWMLWQCFSPAGTEMATGGFRADRLRPVSRWLAAHTPAESVVFHARWEAFAELLLWNRHNRYINGMDPVFLYASYPPHYWKMHHLATGASEYTSGSPRPEFWNRELTYLVLRYDFKAGYLLVEKQESPQLLEYARRDRRFLSQYEDGDVALFEIR